MKFVRMPLMLVLGVLLAIPAVSSAQPGPGPMADCPNPQVQNRFKEARAKILRDHVGLDEETAVQAEQIMDEFMTKRRELQTAMREYHGELRSLLQADSNDQKAYEKALDGITTTQDKLYKLRLDEMDALSEIMTPKEQAKLLGAMQSMRRRAGRRFHGHGPGMGGPGMGGRGMGGPGHGGYGAGMGGPGMGGPGAW